VALARRRGSGAWEEYEAALGGGRAGTGLDGEAARLRLRRAGRERGQRHCLALAELALAAARVWAFGMKTKKRDLKWQAGSNVMPCLATSLSLASSFYPLLHSEALLNRREKCGERFPIHRLYNAS
jgi:hypothetical protein